MLFTSEMSLHWFLWRPQYYSLDRAKLDVCDVTSAYVSALFIYTSYYADQCLVVVQSVKHSDFVAFVFIYEHLK